MYKSLSKPILTMAFLLLLGSNFALSQNVKITQSSSFGTIYIQDSEWEEASKSRAYTASIVTSTILTSLSNLSDTDVLIITQPNDSNIITYSRTIVDFIKAGGNVYIQSEIFYGFSGNMFFKNLMDEFHINFTWDNSSRIDVIEFAGNVSGSISTTPNIVSSVVSMSSCLGGNTTAPELTPFISYDSRNIAFEYKNQTAGHGKVITISDLDWISRQSTPLFLENILYELADGTSGGSSSSSSVDSDGDGIIDANDNCPTTANKDQLDSDGDGIGNVCDLDNDDDGWNDTIEIACGTNPFSSYSKPLDTDEDGIANCQDPDIDNDGCLNAEDAFPLDKTECSDVDKDGIGDNADTDDDNDGQSDVDELKCGSNPIDATSMSPDFDKDGILDCIDEDDDNDGVKDYADAFPFNAAEWADYDHDGTGNNEDTDDDNDGWSDLVELTCGTNPLMVISQPTDLDKDGIADCEDTDIDGDGVLNTQDEFPTNPNEWVDTDKDGAGDNLDVDDDNDGVLDSEDAFPLNSNESKDADGDGIGDNADTDNDNDGFEDTKLVASPLLTPNSGSLEANWVVTNIELYPQSRVRVYDLHGMEVFSKIGYQNDWKGTFKDTEEKLPAGSYYYTIDYHQEGKKTEGWFYLVY